MVTDNKTLKLQVYRSHSLHNSATRKEENTITAKTMRIPESDLDPVVLRYFASLHCRAQQLNMRKKRKSRHRKGISLWSKSNRKAIT